MLKLECVRCVRVGEYFLKGDLPKYHYFKLSNIHVPMPIIHFLKHFTQKHTLKNIRKSYFGVVSVISLIYLYYKRLKGVGVVVVGGVYRKYIR